MVKEQYDRREAERTKVPLGPKIAESTRCSEGGSSKGHTDYGIEAGRPYREGELVDVPGLGAGSFEPAKVTQKHDLIVFDKNNAPRDRKRRPVFGVRASDYSPVCGSKRRKNRGYCGDRARMANGRCHRHGGNARRGVAHPMFRDGATSKYAMSEPMVERYEKFINDRELTHHRTTIASIDALLDELWENYESGVTPELWTEVEKKWQQVRNANAAGDAMLARNRFEELGYLIETGVRASRVPERILKHLAERRKAADSETRRKLSEAMVYSVEEAHVFYTSLGQVLRKHVKDEAQLSAIINDMTAIAGDAGATSGNGPAPPPGR